MRLRIAWTVGLAFVWGCAGPATAPSTPPSPTGEAPREALEPPREAPAPSEARTEGEAEQAPSAQAKAPPSIDPPEASPEEPAARPRPPLSSPSPEYEKVTRLYAQASAELRGGDAKRAETLLDETLEVQPHHRQAVAAKVRLCRDSGRPLEAVDVLNRALGVRPRDGYLLFLKAETLYDAGQPADSMESLLQVLDQGDDVPAARFLRARILADSGDRAGTIAAMDDAIRHGFRDLDRLDTDASFEFLRADDEFRKLVDSTREQIRLARESALLPDPTSSRAPKHPEATELPTLHELQTRLRGAIRTDAGRPLHLDVVGIDGQRLRLSDRLGRVVIVELWGTWSRLSTRELEHLQRLQASVAHLGVDVLTLCREVYHDPALPRERVEVDVQAYRRDYSITLPCAVIDEKTATELGVHEYPTTLFVGRDGKSYLQATGYKDYEVLATLLQTLLEEGPPPPVPHHPPTEEPEDGASEASPSSDDDSSGSASASGSGSDSGS